MPQGPLPITLTGLRRTFAQLKIFAATVFAPTPPATIQDTPVNLDPMGNLIISGAGGFASVLAVANPAGQLVKATAGMLIRVNVTVAGTTNGFIFDSATTGAIATTGAALATAQLVGVIPNTVGPVEFDFPCLVGIVVQTGAGQQVSVSYQ